MIDHDELVAIRTVLADFPEKLQGYWLDTDEILYMLKRGGYPTLPREALVETLKRMARGSDLPMSRRKWGGSRYYLFGNIPDDRRDPKEQFLSIGAVPVHELVSYNYFVRKKEKSLVPLDKKHGAMPKRTKGSVKTNQAIVPLANSATTPSQSPTISGINNITPVSVSTDGEEQEAETANDAATSTADTWSTTRDGDDNQITKTTTDR